MLICGGPNGALEIRIVREEIVDMCDAQFEDFEFLLADYLPFEARRIVARPIVR